MQREINSNIHLGQSVTPFESIRRSAAIDRTASDLHNASQKVKKTKSLIDKGEYDADITRYIPGTLDMVFQGMIDKTKTIEQLVHLSYKDKETLDFQLLLDKNQYTNLNSLHLWFPIRFRKLANPTANLEVALITVNNFFTHWIKETNITKYDNNRQLIPMTTPPP